MSEDYSEEVHVRNRLKGHRSNGRGTPQIDRTFPQPIGEIRLASGTHDPEAFRDINDMMSALCRSIPPRWDVLLAIKMKRIAPLHALGLWRLNKLDEVPSIETLLPLQPEYERWKGGLDVSDAYLSQIESTFKALLRLSSEPVVGDLPMLLTLRREECKDAETLVGFNRSKSHVQAMVRGTLGSDHALYRAVTKVATLPVERTPLRRAKTPVELSAILALLPEPHQSYAWSMVVTGMGPKEYWGEWSLGPGVVSIEGTKRKARMRKVPRWAGGLPVVPRLSRSAFEGMWERRIGRTLGIYDLRRSFATWLEDAGIVRSRQRIYMGHSPGDITGIYQQRELDAYREEDASRLAGYAGKWLPGFHPDTEALQPEERTIRVLHA